MAFTEIRALSDHRIPKLKRLAAIQWHALNFGCNDMHRSFQFLETAESHLKTLGESGSQQFPGCVSMYLAKTLSNV